MPVPGLVIVQALGLRAGGSGGAAGAGPVLALVVVVFSVFPPGLLGPTGRGRAGPTAPVPASSGPTTPGPVDLATSLVASLSSLPMADPGGAGIPWNSASVGPGDLGMVGPGQVRRIIFSDSDLQRLRVPGLDQVPQHRGERAGVRGVGVGGVSGGVRLLGLASDRLGPPREADGRRYICVGHAAHHARGAEASPGAARVTHARTPAPENPFPA